MNFRRIRTVTSGDYKAMRKFCLFLEQRKCLDKLNVLFFRSGKSRTVNKVRTADGKRLDVNNIIIKINGREEQLMVNSIINDFNLICTDSVIY